MHSTIIFLYFHLSSSAALRLNQQGNDIAYSQAPKQLVVVRTAGPRPGQRNRMKEWNKDLQKVPETHFVVSLDTSKVGSSKLQEIYEEMPEIVIHHYNASDVRAIYKGIPPNQNLGRRNSIGRNYHMECSAMAVNFAQNHFAETYDYIWVFEDDVHVCGNVSDLINKYSPSKYKQDLLTTGNFRKITRRHAWGIPGQTWSQKFSERYPTLFVGREETQRFSKGLMSRIDELSRTENVTAMSECFAPTVVKNENMTLESFTKNNLGKWGLFTNFLPEEAAREACKSIAAGDATMNHRAKWAREYGDLKRPESLNNEVLNMAGKKSTNAEEDSDTRYIILN